jgi:hypothetical protein
MHVSPHMPSLCSFNSPSSDPRLSVLATSSVDLVRSLPSNSSSTPTVLACIPSSKSIQSLLQSLEFIDTPFLPEYAVSAFIQKVDTDVTAFLSPSPQHRNDDRWLNNTSNSSSTGAFLVPPKFISCKSSRFYVQRRSVARTEMPNIPIPFPRS